MMNIDERPITKAFDNIQYFKCNLQADSVCFSLEYALIFIIFLKPGASEDVPVFDLLWNLGRYGFSLLFVLLFLSKTLSVTKYPLILFLIALFSTFLHNGMYLKVFAHWFPTLGFMCWLQYFRYDLRNIAHTFFICGGITIILNAMTMLALPNGLWIRAEASAPVWLLGQKQDFITCFLPTAFLGIIANDNTMKMKLFTKVVILFALSSFMIIRPIGLILVLLSVLLLIWFDRDVTKLFTARVLFLVFVIIEVAGIFVAYIYSKLTLFQLFLASIESSGMDKSQTLGVRFQMWMFGLDSFKNSPFIGYGQVTESFWLRNGGPDVYHTILHNLPLDILYSGGGISLVVYLVWNLKMVKELSTYKQFKLSRYMGFFFFALCLISVTECPYQPMVFTIFVFLSNIPYVIAKGYIVPVQKC